MLMSLPSLAILREIRREDGRRLNLTCFTQGNMTDEHVLVTNML